MVALAPRVLLASLPRLHAWVAANTWTPNWRLAALRRPLASYASAVVVVALAAAVTYGVERSVDNYSFHGMIGFLAVLCVAIVLGTAPALVGAALNASLLNFVVVPPRLVSTSPSPGHMASHLVSFALSFLFGVVLGFVAGQEEARRRRMARQHAALQSATTERERVLGRLQAVQAVTDAALAHLPTQDLLRQLLARLAQALAADNAALLLLTEDGRSLVVYLAHGAEEEQVGDIVVPVGQGFAGRIAASRQPLVADDVRSADVSNVQLVAAASSIAGVPVMVEDRLVGVLHADSARPRRFTDEDLEVLRLVAERVGLVVENGRLFAEAQQRSADLATERDRLQRILDVLPEAVVIYDAEARVTAVNPIGEALFGADIVGKKQVGLDLAARLPDGTPLAPEQFPAVQALMTGESVRGVRLVVRTARSGDDVTLVVSSAPLLDENGAIVGTVAVAQDISAIRDLEQQRDRMLATVTHDLRNPLTSISGMSQILQLRVGQVDEPLRERFVHGLQIIETAAQRMTEQISELLDYARVQTGRQVALDSRPTDVIALLRKTLEEHQRSTERHTLELQSEEERLVTLLDPQQLERAMANLLVNAIKYSPRGGPIVVAVARSLGPDGQWLRIAVADSGLGIPSADLPHICEQYYRASNVTTTIPGTGIGLANVRHMAERHGGTMSIDSTEGVGTTVTLQLPLRRAEDAQVRLER